MMRSLTDSEILDILTSIPKIVAGTPEVADKTRSEISDNLFFQLKEIQIIDNPDAISELKLHIHNSFLRSVITPGEPIGITCGEAIAAPLTQLNLNSFHAASSATSVGTDAFKELFNASANRKKELITLHFKDKKLSREEVLEYRRELIGITILELCLYNEILNSREEDEYWYQIYEKLFSKKLVKSNYFLRLHFDINALYKYKITLSDIISKIEEENDQLKTVICISSPISIGIIDIYCVTENMTKALQSNIISDNNLSLIYLQQIIKPNLGQYTIKGIAGIKNLHPITISLTSLIKFCEKLENPREWNLWIDLIEMRSKGVRIKQLVKFLEDEKIQVLNLKKQEKIKDIIAEKPLDYELIGKRFIKVLMPTDETPENFFRRRKDGNIYQEEVLKKSPNVEDIVPDRTKEAEESGESYKIKKENIEHFKKKSTYTYAILIGKGLKKILSLNFVDNTLTLSNNVNEILSTFGIEVARNFIIQNFHDMIKEAGSYINQKYIVLLSEIMTNKGIISGITAKGVSSYNRETFAEASFQLPLENFTKSAISGRLDTVSSTSSCIFMGKRVPIGTGLPKFALKEEVLNYLKTIEIEEPNVQKKSTEDDFEFIDPNEQTISIKDLLSKMKNFEPKKTSALIRGNVKGPLPDLAIVDKLNPIIESALENVEYVRTKLPRLGYFNLTQVLEQITQKNSIIEENEVKFIDLQKFKDSLKNYL